MKDLLHSEFPPPAANIVGFKGTTIFSCVGASNKNKTTNVIL